MRRILPPSYVYQFGLARRVELAADRPIRTRNTLRYRLAHWPIWIWVFFIAPGPITFTLFASGPNSVIGLWLLAVVAGTGVAALRGRLPGVESGPYVVRFGDDRPNPLYRRVCYTLAWSEIVAYAVLNSAGLLDAVVTGTWRLQAIYQVAYLPLAASVWALGFAGLLPRAGRSTRHEGIERRYFYGSLWAVCTAQPVLWLLWKALPLTREADLVKLVAFWGIIGVMGFLALRGRLPRTRPILPGQLGISD